MFLKQIIKKIILYPVNGLGYEIVRKTDIRDQDKYLDQREFRYILWLDRIYQKIATVPGHIIELGVARGRNSIIFGNLIQLSGDDAIRNYYGFDTFEGYSRDDFLESPYLSKSDWKNTSESFVKQRIHDAGLGEICHLVKGDLKETIPEFLNTNSRYFVKNHLRIALLYVDCNAYLPAITGMELFKDYMSPGGVICIDEKTQGGETRALVEYCKKYNLPFTKDASPFSVPAFTIIK